MRYTPRPYIPDVDTTPRPLPPSLLEATCEQAFGWWIECRCTGPGCYGGSTDYPVRLLIIDHHCAERRLLDVAARLRCKRCRSKPSGLRLVDDVARRPSAHSGIPPGGGEPATVIDLLPLLAMQAHGATTALPVTPTTWLCPVTSLDLERDPAKRQALGQLFGLADAAAGLPAQARRAAGA